VTEGTKRAAPENPSGETTKSPVRVISLVEAQAEVAAKARGTGAPRPVRLRPKGQRIPPLGEADAVSEALYAKRQYVYPRQVHGFFANWRVAMVFATLGVFYLLPWINWGAGRQAFLIDLPNRKFNLFFWTFWPQDLFYLTAILVISALSLFLFTAIAGRLWCGYTCPQTVWTEVFLWIERQIEGDRPRQMKLAAAPWGAEKIVKKGGKHVVWIAFALWTGFTFVGYFTPIRELSVSAASLTLGPWETFWILFYGFATYGNAGWLREQVCLYMCPYARFQGAMFDRDTLIISYDQARGEPRGSRKRGEDYRNAGLGDCIDCTLCVQVCPTGIDIRHGLQVGCIACAACVDVCDTVMDKMGYAKGLIRYTTENEMALGTPRKILRPRVLFYSGLLATIAVALVVAVLLRVPLDIDVIRDRNSLYRESRGMIENVYTLKLMNMDTAPHTYLLSAAGLEGLSLRADSTEIRIESGDVVELPVTLVVPPESLKSRSEAVEFRLEAVDNPRHRVVEDARFLGPGGVR
jgi:cytochrome c oxidase accessory protein FixG